MGWGATAWHDCSFCFLAVRSPPTSLHLARGFVFLPPTSRLGPTRRDAERGRKQGSPSDMIEGRGPAIHTNRACPGIRRVYTTSSVPSGLGRPSTCGLHEHPAHHSSNRQT